MFLASQAGIDYDARLKNEFVFQNPWGGKK
jgi:hypothetical protein